MPPNYVPYGDVYNAQDYGREYNRPYDDRPRHDDRVHRQEVDRYYYPPARPSHRDRERSEPRHYRPAEGAHRRPRRRPSRSRSRSRSSSRSSSPRQRIARQRRTQSENRNYASEEQQPQESSRADRVKSTAEKYFDLSPNGAMAATLGAGAGAIGVRRFGQNQFKPGTSDKIWRTVGGAVAGGVAANAAENYATKAWNERKGEKDRERGTGYEQDRRERREER